MEKMQKSVNIVKTLSDTLVRGQFGYKIVTETEPGMRKTGNPFVGRVKKATEYVNAAVGVEYQNACNNRLEKKGLERDYVSEKPSGKKWFNHFFYVSDKDPDTFYLKIGVYQGTTQTHSAFFVDGRPATEEETEAIKAFCYDRKPSAKQARHGLSPNEEYILVAPKAENVVSVCREGRVYYRRPGSEGVAV